MKDNILISICIPTYNRGNKLKNQLEFLIEEIINCNDKVEILVGDNCSNDNTFEIVKNISIKNNNIKYFQNGENLGIAGNIEMLFSHSNGKYIWFLGDDDRLEKYSIENLIKYIYKNYFSIDLLLINHYVIKKNQRFKFYDFDCVNIKRLSNIFIDRYHNGLMFISSLIYRKQLISNLIHDKHINRNITLPLGLSLVSGKKNIKIFEKPIIYNEWGNTSWSNEAYKVNSIDKVLLLNRLENVYGLHYLKKFMKFYSFNLNLIKFIFYSNISYRERITILKNLVKSTKNNFNYWVVFRAFIIVGFTLIVNVINKKNNR